jgi:hypothetical protein
VRRRYCLDWLGRAARLVAVLKCAIKTTALRAGPLLVQVVSRSRSRPVGGHRLLLLLLLLCRAAAALLAVSLLLLLPLLLLQFRFIRTNYKINKAPLFRSLCIISPGRARRRGLDFRESRRMAHFGAY